MTCHGGAVHIDVMAAKESRSARRTRVLLCIVCSGGARDRNGAYTLCALCELQGADVPAETPMAA